MNSDGFQMGKKEDMEGEEEWKCGCIFLGVTDSGCPRVFLLLKYIPFHGLERTSWPEVTNTCKSSSV